MIRSNKTSVTFFNKLLWFVKYRSWYLENLWFDMIILNWLMIRCHEKVMNNIFIKPLHLASNLSGYPNLMMLYSIFSCLTVSSASAERALSKLKIVKNRLRSSMSDKMLSFCLILASEKDIVSELFDEDIIQQFAQCSPSSNVAWYITSQLKDKSVAEELIKNILVN